MNKYLVLGAASAALLATPLLAQLNAAPQRGASVTRAQAEANVRIMFGKVDANRDGFVTQAEAQTVRTAHKAQRQAVRGERRAAMFARLDANADGMISRAEFDAPRADRGDRAEQREARAERRGDRRERRAERRGMRGQGFGANMFARLDGDKDGRVSLAEATAARLQRFDRLDANKDGTLTREERRAAREARRG